MFTVLLYFNRCLYQHLVSSLMLIECPFCKYLFNVKLLRGRSF